MDEKTAAFPLFKGATRTPMFMGVPLFPLILGLFVVFIMAMTVSIFAWALFPVVVFIMRLLVKHDDKAFNILGLCIDTRWRNPNKNFWNASSYAPAPTKWQRRRRGR